MRVASLEPSLSETDDAMISDRPDWQTHLLGLLCRLEHCRTEMAGHRLIAGASELIRLAKTMLRECEAVAMLAPSRHAHISLQMQTMARSGKFFAAANALQPPETRSMMRSLLSRIMGEPSRQTASTVQDCLLDAHEAVRSYFNLFAHQFDSTQAGKSWSDVAEAFESEFKDLICVLPA